MGRIVSERYELTTQVGVGPVTVAWRAWQRGGAGFVRPVLVRELRDRYAKDPRFVGTWVAAGTELAALFRHGVEALCDVVVEDERVYLVSEWIEGVSLTRWIERQGAQSAWPLAVQIGIDVLEALKPAHARQPALCHGGIRPSAVRLAVDGRARLTRFGAFAALAASGQGRREIEAMGFGYRAPEVTDGRAIAPATDQHGVASLVFELLGGARPFADDAAMQRGEVWDLSVVRDDLPPLLATHLERALCPDAELRFADVHAFQAALVQVLEAAAQHTVVAKLAEQVGELLRQGLEPAAPQVTGVAALAASVRQMAESSERPVKPVEPAPQGAPPAKAPRGLPADQTMHVSMSDLTTVTTERGNDEPKRYRFAGKERRAIARAEAAKKLGLTPQESEAAPLPLTNPKQPEGLSPARTEFLDADQVDRLTLPDAKRGQDRAAVKRPLGLGVQKTEFLDEDQVDRLKIDE